ncbi:Prefoldin subunit-domain-containing protein [Hypomontagnella submonticulosa]|nr:Prefoldin subunit-domain-containing protein [Hypomontagnella submonticulosa]
MMAAAKDSFLDLERHRQMLEENVKRLSNALDNWKQWKQEYEALRTDVKSLPSSAGRRDLREAREHFKGDVLNEKELADIFGRDDSKKVEQITSTLTNRLDYVTKNISTLSAQLEEAKNKLAAVSVIVNPDATDEEGLPITEIFEELDDEDNVVSFSLRTPGDRQPQILEALRKAGITDIPESPSETQDGAGPSKGQPDLSAQQPESLQNEQTPKDIPTPSTRKPNESPVEEKSKTTPTKKKSVTFSEDTKLGDQQEQSETAKRLEEIMKTAREQQSIISDPVFPADESPEDAALREDMLRYNKETMEFEMAPIVAELQLEEGSTGDDTDDYSDYDEDDGDLEEDEWGKTKLNMSDEWKLQMLELKERLSNYTFGRDKVSDDDEDMVEGLGRISIRREGQPVSNSEAKGEAEAQPEPENTENAKKSVRFAQSLDIAEAPAPASKQAPVKQPKQPEVEPMSEIVMERSGSAPQPKAATPKKASRFRKERSNKPPIGATPKALDGTPIAPDRPDNAGMSTPSGPEGQVVAGSVLEHEPSSKPKEPDEFEANLLQKQATEELYKLRNKLVYRQGGFLKEDENPIQPLDEEEGGPKRMSRFKAARLAKS